MNVLDKKSSNPCTRCGRQRIDLKFWQETVQNMISNTVITHTDTVCPDSECQKIVAEKLALQRQKMEDIKREKEERIKRLQESRKGN